MIYWFSILPLVGKKKRTNIIIRSNIFVFHFLYIKFFYPLFLFILFHLYWTVVNKNVSWKCFRTHMLITIKHVLYNPHMLVITVSLMYLVTTTLEYVVDSRSHHIIKIQIYITTFIQSSSVVLSHLKWSIIHKPYQKQLLRFGCDKFLLPHLHWPQGSHKMI